MGRWMAGALLGLVVLIAGVRWQVRAFADDNPLAHAARLRDEAAEDWNRKRYADAAEKLTRASAIYDGAVGETNSDRAITWRALIWNLVRSADIPRALQYLDRLIALAKEDPSISGEIDSAFGALWEAAKGAGDFEAGRRILDAVRQAARRHGNERLWAQATHNLGSLARDAGEKKTAASMFEAAAGVRKEIGDVVGQVWSLNNLANLHLRDGELDEALEPLAQAHRLMHQEHVVQPQSAIAWNLDKVIALFEKRKVDTGPDWLHARAEIARHAGFGAMLPASQLDRAAIRVAATLEGHDAATKKLLQAIVETPEDPGVPEIHADLALRAARLAVTDLHAQREAGRWLHGLDLGHGPCRPHLAARLALVQALVLARPDGKAGDFAKAASAAADAWRELGDFQGRRNALAALVDAAERASLTDAIADVVAEHEKARRDGAPGGAAGSARSGGDRSRARDVPLDADVLRISMQPDGKIRVDDQVASYGFGIDPAWHATNLCVNGIALTFFGGYVAVRSASYGGSAVATGASGNSTLEDLPRYVPIPAKVALLVEKNGAVHYAPTR